MIDINSTELKSVLCPDCAENLCICLNFKYKRYHVCEYAASKHAKLCLPRQVISNKALQVEEA